MQHQESIFCRIRRDREINFNERRVHEFADKKEPILDNLSEIDEKEFCC